MRPASASSSSRASPGVATQRAQRLRHRLLERHARHLGRVLHGEEQPGVGALPGGQAEQVVAVERDRAAEDLVAGPAHEHVRERGLARAVGAHDRVHLAAAHLEVEAAQDLAPLDTGPQAVDPKRRSRDLHHDVVAVDDARRRRAPAGWPGSDCGSPSTSENVLPCFQHSISRSSPSTSPSASEKSAWLQRSPMA